MIQNTQIKVPSATLSLILKAHTVHCNILILLHVTEHVKRLFLQLTLHIPSEFFKTRFSKNQMDCTELFLLCLLTN